MIEAEKYKKDFCQKFTPWLEEKWGGNNAFRRWVDLPAFLQEQTHGLTHSVIVRAKAYFITQKYLHPQEEHVDEDLLDIMAVFHDIARHMHCPYDKENILTKKHKLTQKEWVARKSNFHHELVGAAMAHVVCTQDAEYKNLLKRKGLGIFRQLLSHDYHSQLVTPYCRPPATLEGQLFCIADKTSIDPLQEVRRRHQYLTTRPNNPVPLLDPEFPLEERQKWRFQMEARDALCAIIPIFSFNPDFASSQGIKEYYRDWSVNLDSAAKEIILISEYEGGDMTKEAVIKILKAFGIK